jgi:endonuclease/exonuclease/phosphatase family metal-dependent hydrolase
MTTRGGEGSLGPAITVHPAGDIRLAGWRDRVGPPIALELAPPLAAPPEELDVLCWNVGIGRGRLGALLGHLRSRRLIDPPGSGGVRPLVVLAQEAYRTGADVPRSGAGGRRSHGGRGGGPGAHDIAAAAVELGMSLRYVPSMGNRHAGSDRGNAILATAALGASEAWELPLVRQRRVAVAASLAAFPQVRFVSAHLENRAALRSGRPGGSSGRAAQAGALADLAARRPGDVVLGADLNSLLGRRDPAFRRLAERGFVEPDGAGGWVRTLRGPLPLLLDHVLVRGAGAIRDVRVLRIDGTRRLGTSVFGSDHHPLLARVRLGTADT